MCARVHITLPCSAAGSDLHLSALSGQRRARGARSEADAHGSDARVKVGTRALPFHRVWRRSSSAQRFPSERIIPRVCCGILPGVERTLQHPPWERHIWRIRTAVGRARLIKARCTSHRLKSIILRQFRPLRPCLPPPRTARHRQCGKRWMLGHHRLRACRRSEGDLAALTAATKRDSYLAYRAAREAGRSCQPLEGIDLQAALRLCHEAPCIRNSSDH